ncbi:hypothetical protein MMC21_001895 [Puttea exsequens]|nr:hypothetical protein [Puttea exsequens]
MVLLSHLMLVMQLLLVNPATSAPTNTTELISSISPVKLEADECPTPPTQFLPYPPPAGFQPGPGCEPASSGTQPTEFNPPPGVYGGTGSGGGSGGGGTVQSNKATGLRGLNPLAKVLAGVFSGRKSKVNNHACHDCDITAEA